MIAIEPAIHRWTRGEYQQMLDLGWFPNQRVELVEGEIRELPVMRNAHAVSLKLTEDALVQAYGKGYWVRNQLPIAINEYSEPLPDLAVVPGKPRDYTQHPSTAILVVEVSDSTLAYDRRRKGSLYAMASLNEYWIVNLVDRQLEIYKTPIADGSWPYGWRYASDTIIDAAGQIVVGSTAIAIAELLP